MNNHRLLIAALVRKLCISLLLTCICTGLLGYSAGARAAAKSAGAEYVPGRILIGLKHRPSADGMVRLSSAVDADVTTTLPGINLLVMSVPVGGEAQALERARQNPDVAYAELDYIAHAAGPAAAIWPDDPGLSQQWALEKMGLPFAWDYSQGSPAVLVAVLDSGVRLAHPDLQGQIWTNPDEIPGNNNDDDGNGKIDDVHGWHFYHLDLYTAYEDGNVEDDNGHGTHVTGIITAKANNGYGTAGIASGSQVLPVKVLNSQGNGAYSDIISGIYYAVDQGARIINLSLGGTADTESLREAVAYARDHDVLVVAAAGNCSSLYGACMEPVMYPAAIDTVLAVAASDPDDARAYFSNVGPQVDLSAPGTDILSTNRYDWFSWGSGTSFAAPQVAGIAALLWSYKPELSLSELEDLLTSATVDIEAPGKDDLTGWGRVSASRALGKINALSDPWVACDYERGAQNEDQRFVVRYGNGGYADANDAEVTTFLTLPGESAQETTWPAITLSAGAEPEALPLPVPVDPAGGIISLSVQINSTSPDFEASNNQAYCQASYRWMTFMPLIAKDNVSK